MRYLVNPSTKRKSARRKKAPSRAQLAARKKFVAMARARSAAAKKSKRATSGGGTMAAKKRKSSKRRYSTNAPSRKRSAKRGRRYLANAPKRGKRRGVGRRRYRRNPDIMGMVKGLAIDAGAGVAGFAAGQYVLANIGPKVVSAGDKPTTAAVKQFALGAVTALAIRLVGGKFVPMDVARIAAATALIPSTKALIYAFAAGDAGTNPVPTFLGRDDNGVTTFRRFPSNPRALSGYAGSSPRRGAPLAGYAGASDPRLAAYVR